MIRSKLGIWLIAIIAIVSLLVTPDFALAAKKNNKKRRAAKKNNKNNKNNQNPVNFIYSIGIAQYNCTHNITRKARFEQCSDLSTPLTSTLVRLGNAQRQKNWVKLCTQECIKRNIERADPFRTCLGVMRKTAKICALVECGSGQQLLSPIPFKLRKKNQFAPISGELESKCFQQMPTSSPTTTAPTPRPTKPTSAPIPACSVSGKYALDFASLEGADPKLDEYQLLQPKKQLCEIIRPKSLVDITGIEIVENFGCTLEACVRWCSYANYCTFAMYSPVERKCYRANNLEMTDQSDSYQSFYDSQWVVYKKNIVTDIPYFAGKCNEYVPSMCNKDKECGWNKGKRGYNDPLQGGSAGGYCGRVKCLAASG